nr:MAG TPA: hypothetical protein [Caudoviricetes sp.]
MGVLFALHPGGAYLKTPCNHKCVVVRRFCLCLNRYFCSVLE